MSVRGKSQAAGIETEWCASQWILVLWVLLDFQSSLASFPIFHIYFPSYVLLPGPNAQGRLGDFVVVTQHENCRTQPILVKREKKRKAMNSSETLVKPLRPLLFFCCNIPHILYVVFRKHVVKPRGNRYHRPCVKESHLIKRSRPAD